MGKIEGKKRRGQQRMSWLDSITDPLDMNLSKLWEIVEDRGGWHAVVHGVRCNLATEQQQLECTTPRMSCTVSCGLWVIMMCQCRLIFGKREKSIFPVSDDANRRDLAFVGAGDVGKLCTFSSIFL